MRPVLTAPPALLPGDRVAVVSLSFAAPALFPAVHALAMERLRNELGLEPVEFPTTRQLGAPPAERARDLMAAFADPTIRAVLATIGGHDSITVLPFLDAEVVAANPKPFLGYSDNTSLLNWLWRLGIVGYHGGSTMVHLGRGGGLHPMSMAGLRAALFTRGDVALTSAGEFSEDEIDWEMPAALEVAPLAQPGLGWQWHQPNAVVRAPTWGGNLEILNANLAASVWIRPVDDYAGCILLLETSEELPDATNVEMMLNSMGERGLLRQFPAVVVGLAKAATLDPSKPAELRAAYRAEQRAVITSVFTRYNPSAMLVFNVDLGHTDPQWVLPYGGELTVDGPGRRITAHF